MKLRFAKFEDWKIILDWRNDPTTRNNSFNQEEISEDKHKQWFMQSLLNKDRSIYILEDENIPVGSIRSDFTDDKKYTLSWSIAPNHRGKGYGTKMLELFLKNKTGEFIAEIKPENKPSIKMVENNGFCKLDEITYTKKIVVTDLEIIDEIQKIRNRNNINWMDILRIAFTHAPEEARSVFKKITIDDNLINELSKKLADNNNGKNNLLYTK